MPRTAKKFSWKQAYIQLKPSGKGLFSARRERVRTRNLFGQDALSQQKLAKFKPKKQSRDVEIDKNAETARQFYKTVRSKPKGKHQKGSPAFWNAFAWEQPVI